MWWYYFLFITGLWDSAAGTAGESFINLFYCHAAVVRGIITGVACWAGNIRDSLFYMGVMAVCTPGTCTVHYSSNRSVPCDRGFVEPAHPVGIMACLAVYLHSHCNVLTLVAVDKARNLDGGLVGKASFGTMTLIAEALWSIILWNIVLISIN